MLTAKQPVSYGYRSVHDLPTPPSTSRTSPPLIYQDSAQKPLPAIPQGGSPPSQPMSSSHRGLPPPAAMTLAQPPPAGVVPPPPPPLAQQAGPLGPSPGSVLAPQGQHFGPLPGPPPQWQGAEESMRAWLLAKTEEERRRQEEERTRQETLRLEQRRTEHDILRTSLEGGIPPPMVPVVFAGMGGGALPQAAMDWAQQYVYSQTQHGHTAALPPSGHISPDHQRRDSQAQQYSQYPVSGGVPSTPGSTQGPPAGYAGGYPTSPTRPRGQSFTGPGGRPLGPGSNLPTLNTNVQPGQSIPGGVPGHPGMSSGQQQEAQSSPSIYFHHWQPPTGQGGRGSSDQASAPSGESPRKRKATGSQPPPPPPNTEARRRSPPFGQNTGLSNPPPSRRRGHARQRSDFGSYRSSGRGRMESYGPMRAMSPMLHAGTAGAASAREGNGGGEGSSTPAQASGRSAAHTVSSLLSDQSPPHMPSRYAEDGPQPEGDDARAASGQPEGAPIGTAHDRSEEYKRDA